MSAWATTLRERQVALAWLSLDVGDNDPVRFWHYVVAALEDVHPGVGQDAVLLLRAPRPAVETALTALINTLATSSALLVLILDDYHVINALAVHESLGFLIDNMPSQLRVASQNELIRYCRWHGCEPVANSPNSACRTCASLPVRPVHF
jgi:LuxR family maltose regulon positive regulatory protein